jgi:uncharacterized protein (TIGR02271 family)
LLNKALFVKFSKDRNSSQPDCVVPLAEETARVEKSSIATGKLRIRTSVEEVEKVVATTLDGEVVDIVHVPIDREVSDVPTVKTETGVTIVPVLEEVLVVEKRLILKEEIHIHRRAKRERIETPIKLRKQRVNIERVAHKTNTTESKEKL